MKGSNLNCPRSHPTKTPGWDARPRNTASCTNVSFNSRKTLCLCICCIYSYSFGYIPQWPNHIRTGCLPAKDKRFPAARLIYEFLRHDDLESVIMSRRTEGRHFLILSLGSLHELNSPAVKHLRIAVVSLLSHARSCWMDSDSRLQHCCIRSDQIFSHIILSRSHCMKQNCANALSIAGSRSQT